jgi:hypothetical protein
VVGTAGDTERRTYQDSRYQSASPEQRRTVDEVADDLLRMTPAQAEKIKQAIKLLTPDADTHKT